MLRFAFEAALIVAATAVVVHKIRNEGDRIMGSIADQLNALTPQFDKVLEEIRRSKEVSPEDQAAIDAHKARLQQLDDENPDAPAPEPTPEPEPAPEPSPEPTEPA